MTPTFFENGGIGEGLNDARWCAIDLCGKRAIIKCIRIVPNDVVIEIEGPLEIGREPEIKNGYAAVRFNGCSVAWKLEEEKKSE